MDGEASMEDTHSAARQHGWGRRMGGGGRLRGTNGVVWKQQNEGKEKS